MGTATSIRESEHHAASPILASRPTISVVLVDNCAEPLGASQLRAEAIDEVIHVVGQGEAANAGPAAIARSGYRRIVARKPGVAHAINLGVAQASSTWVVIAFGDEDLAEGWVDQICAYLSVPGSRCIHLCEPRVGVAFPLVIVRREAFVYGAFDERFPCDRLAALHWVHRVFTGPVLRILDDEGISQHTCAFLGASQTTQCNQPLVALLELWHYLVPPLRAALLRQALSHSHATWRTMQELEEAMAARDDDTDPYRAESAYEAKSFWENNSAGYIRWEIYQPDEPEIIELLRRVTPATVLELGCGAGRNARYFSAVERYSGIDLSTNLLHRAAERQEQCSIGLTCGDVTVLPYGDSAFDLVFSDSTIQHVTDDRIERCVAEILRVASDYICLIEYTEEDRVGGEWFNQIHMFAHDYFRLFSAHCELVWRIDTRMKVHPARKELFLFRKHKRAD